MSCSGIIFGWASIAGTILIAPEEKGGANLTRDQATLIFSIAASSSSLSCLVLGYILDAHGPRVCSLVGHFIVAMGFFLLSQEPTLFGILLGVCLIGFGGPSIQSALFHLTNLFPDSKFAVMSCLSGSFSVSFAIFPFFDYLWQNFAISFQVMTRSYILVVGLSSLASHFFWPNVAITELDDQIDDDNYDYNQEFIHDDSNLKSDKRVITAESAFLESAAHPHLLEAPLNSYLRSNPRRIMNSHPSFQKSVASMLTAQYVHISIKDNPFWNQLSSGVYARILLVFITTSFWANLYIASLPTELAVSHGEINTTSSNLGRTFTLITSTGVVVSFLIGVLMDRAGLVACTLLTLLLGQLHMLFLILGHDNQAALLLGFVVYTFFRQILYPLYIACLSARLGFKYFGILSGIGFTLSGITQLGMAPLVLAVQGDHWMALHISQFLVLTILWGVPAVDAFYSQNPISIVEVATNDSLLHLPKEVYEFITDCNDVNGVRF
jgi:MFS family permease